MKKPFIYLVLLFCILSCSNDDSEQSTENDTDETGVDITSVVQEYFSTTNGVSVVVSDDVITITSSTGLPDHKTPYYDVYDKEHELYEDFPTYSVTDAIYDNFYFEPIASRIFNEDATEITYAANDNDEIAQVVYVMEIPTHPVEADVKEDTELSAIGMVLNGVPFFNDLNRDSDLLGAADVSTLDAAGGHPGANLDYHYHLGANPGIYTDEDPEVAYGTVIDEDNLVGFMRDGFPLYGLLDQDGTYPDDLDEYGGHVGVTEEFPDGIYHYHASAEDFLDSGWHVLKSGAYYGTPGSFTTN